MSEPNKIDKRITGWAIKKDEVSAIVPVVVPPPTPHKLERGDILTGSTYKVKQPLYWEHGFYLTINNIVVGEEVKPFEIFITSKNSECLPLLEVLSLTLTSMFRLQIDISFLLEEYRTIQDPKGGYRGKRVWLRDKPKYYTSLLGEFADVIEAHLLGLVEVTNLVEVPPTTGETKIVYPSGAMECPDCHEIAMIKVEGCNQCLSCNYSKCN